MNKVGNCSVNELATRNPIDALYADYMAKEIKKAVPNPIHKVPDTFKGKPIKELTPEEREEFIFSMQPESTQKAMIAQKSRAPEDDLEYLLRPIDPSYLADPNAKDLDDLIKARRITPEEYTTYNRLRKSQRNTLGDSRQASINEESKARAVHAFTYSKPYEPNLTEMKKLKKLTELVNTALPDPFSAKEEYVPPTHIFARILYWWADVIYNFEKWLQK